MDDQISSSKKQGLFELLGPGKTFAFGIIVTILVGSTIGFFVLLFTDSGTALTSNTNTKTFAGTTNTAVTNTAAAPQPTPTAPTPSTSISIQPVTSDDHIKGDLDTAEVVVVEFSDTECPFCKRFHPTMEQVVSDYDGKVAWVYRHFPLDSLHSKARNEAIATECAAEQGGNDGFWAYLDRLMEITPSNNGLQESQLPEIATFIGLDVTQFQTCLDDQKYADVIRTHEQDATAAGGQGTPYSVAIGSDGTMIPISGAQPIASVKSAIDSLL